MDKAIETLHCQQCGNDFTRKRKRGVKPKTCPPCKAKQAVVRTSTSTSTSTGNTITNSRESHQAKRDQGISLYCAHPKDLGKLCKREGYDTECTCDCH